MTIYNIHCTISIQNKIPLFKIHIRIAPILNVLLFFTIPTAPCSLPLTATQSTNTITRCYNFIYGCVRCSYCNKYCYMYLLPLFIVLHVLEEGFAQVVQGWVSPGAAAFVQWVVNFSFWVQFILREGQRPSYTTGSKTLLEYTSSYCLVQRELLESWLQKVVNEKL